MSHSVEEAIRSTGIKDDSYLFSLFPKMCEFLVNCKSDNTVKAYFNAFKRWERFVFVHGHRALPAQAVHVTLYLSDLLNNASSEHPVSNAVHGIKWIHEINGLDDPTKTISLLQ